MLAETADKSPDDPRGLVEKSLGKYRIERFIDAGSNGCVYLARAYNPDREVAVKVLNPSRVLGTHFRDRFEIEKEILAKLRVSGIAQFYDADSEWIEGRNIEYFVMEHIEGTTLTAAVRDYDLGLKQRLQLMIKLCDPVIRAHSRNIVHGDLKSDNIRVRVLDHNKDLEPVLLDFGLAHLIGEGEKNIADDVEQLGAVLFELLSNRLSQQSTGDAHYLQWEMLSSDERDAVIKHGFERCDGRTCGPRDPLHSLLVTALGVNGKREQYRNVTELETEITDYLGNKPVRAHGGGKSYRGWLAMRRHPFVSILFIFITVLLVAVTHLAYKEAAERQRAQEARQRANTAQANAEKQRAMWREATRILQGIFTSVQPPGSAKTREATVEDALRETCFSLDRGEFTAYPEFEAEIRITIGVVFRQWGEYEEALQHLRLAHEIRGGLFPREAPEVAESGHHLGNMYRLLGNYHEAERLLSDALAVRQSTLGDCHPRVAETMNTLGVALETQGRWGEAECYYRDAVQCLQDYGEECESELATSAHNLGLILFRLGKTHEAETWFNEVAAIRSRLYRDSDPAAGAVLISKAMTLWHDGKLAEAEQFLQDSLAISRDSWGQRHPRVAVPLTNLGVVLREQSKLSHAENLLREALSILQDTLPQDHIDLAAPMQELALTLTRAGKYEEARLHFTDALVIARNMLGDRHPNVLVVLSNRAKLYEMEGCFERAEADLRSVVELRTEILGKHHFKTLIAQNRLANILRMLDRLEEAEVLGMEVVSAARRNTAMPEWIRGYFEVCLGKTISQQNRFDEAEVLVRSGLETLRGTRGSNDQKTQEAEVALSELRIARESAAAVPSP